jgi:hypothetical protein
MKTFLTTCLIAVCFVKTGTYASPPIWWASGNPPVLDPSAASNNKGPANIGQAKWMAKNALDALRVVSPATAEAVENELVVMDPNAIPPETKPIKSWAAPATPEEQAAQRAPLLIGQLKAISAPFYAHLNTLNPTWLENERILNQTAVPGSHFPWTDETTDDSNKSVATIGQLKSVFSLRFESLSVVGDEDGDGVTDSEDADPNDASVGRLSISITSPLSGATVR